MSTMLPAPPKTLGRLGDVLISALGSVTGERNPLGLKGKRSVCVLLVDGLGATNLTFAGGHASFLNGQPFEKISCFFPATTSTSLTGLATGRSPLETGFVGYQVFDRELRRGMNLLSGWNDFDEGQTFQKLETVSERANGADIPFHVVSLPSYEKTGLTGATMRDVNFHGFAKMSERFQKAGELLKDDSGKVIFLYVPELDQIAHQFGSQSNKWLSEIESLDSIVRGLVTAMPSHSGLLITADHGVIDIPTENHIYIDESFGKETFEFVGGDTRGLFLYLETDQDVNRVSATLVEKYSDSCWVLRPEEIISSGYWPEVAAARDNIPDLFLLARKRVALYHRSFAKMKSLQMVGHHGSITNDELAVPLMKFNF